MHADQSYKEGQVYTYSLEGTSVSSVSEGQGEATLKLKGDVELIVKPECTRQIRLKNVQVNGAVSNNYFSTVNYRISQYPFENFRMMSFEIFRTYLNKILRSTHFSLTTIMDTSIRSCAPSLEILKPLLTSRGRLSLFSNPP